MRTIVRDSKGINEINMESAIRGQRIICLTGEITDETAMEFIEQIMYFALEDDRQPVKVFINSPGGSFQAGMMIYDAIQTSRLPIELYCIGTAYSMAALIFACGKDGRYILPHGSVLLHEPLIPYGIGGKTSSIQFISEELKKVKNDMDELLAKHTGQAKDKLDEITKQDCIFKGKEAVEFGLADGIMGLAEMLGKTA